MCCIIHIVFYWNKNPRKKSGLLAQLVEHSTLNRRVRGSSPRQPTKRKNCAFARFQNTNGSPKNIYVFLGKGINKRMVIDHLIKITHTFRQCK